MRRFKVAEEFMPIVQLVFSNVKTWFNGIHHGVSAKHLQAYVSKFTFRFNGRLCPFNAFRSLLGIAGNIEAPTVRELYLGEWQRPTYRGYRRSQAAEKGPTAAMRSENDRRRGGGRASAAALRARVPDKARSFSSQPFGPERFSTLRVSLAARDAQRHRHAPSSYSAPKIATIAAVATFSAAC
jgi:hypothetical protein